MEVNSKEYKLLHSDLRNEWPPRPCIACGSFLNIDLANLTGIYDRNSANWGYLCRSHHRKLDHMRNPNWGRKTSKGMIGLFAGEKHPLYRHDITRDKVLEFQAQGLTTYDIAKRFQTSPEVIKRRLNRFT